MKVIEDFQRQIENKDRLAKDMVIDTVNDDLEDDKLSTQHILKFKSDNCSFEGKTMKGLFFFGKKSNNV